MNKQTVQASDLSSLEKEIGLVSQAFAEGDLAPWEAQRQLEQLAHASRAAYMLQGLAAVGRWVREGVTALFTHHARTA